MPYDARTFSILIASPGDVQDERKAIAEIIYDWNHAYSRDRGIVLLPLRWETHSYPEMGQGPQEIINRQVVDSCDLAVGVFWTRLGTPTRIADSGTAEEIERVGESGRPVMLYFSNSPVSLSGLDLDEIARLRNFERKQYPQGLVEKYDSLQEFRDKFSRQLAMRIQEMATDDARKRAEERSAPSDNELPRDLLIMAAYEQSSEAQLPNPFLISKIRCSNPKEIPDYVRSPSGSSGAQTGAFSGPTILLSTGEMVASDGHISSSYTSSNKDYLRQMVAYAESYSTQFALRFGFYAPSKTVRDIHVEMRIAAESSTLAFSGKPLSGPVPTPSASGYYVSLGAPTYGSLSSSVDIARPRIMERNGPVKVDLDIPVVQQERTVFSEPFYLSAKNGGIIEFEATVYSGDSKPFILNSEFTLKVTDAELPYAEILSAYKIVYAE